MADESIPSNAPAALKAFALALADELKREPGTSIAALKNKLAPRFKIAGVPKNAAILSALPAARRTSAIVLLLRTRLTRTASGVTPVAVMPKPFPCPGRCTYCPTAMKEEIGPDGTSRPVMFAPKAYTGFEPATRRAIQNDFDAAKQISVRLSQYEALGQPTQKCELILMGGTFLSVPVDYQDQFVKECYDAFNEQKSRNMAEAQKTNESSLHRVIGLTVETRPDWCDDGHVARMLEWGATRVELGVQSLDDAVLEKVRRGHSTACTATTTARLKDAAFKVGYHFMPGLYASHAQDVAMMRRLFEDSRFCPDMLKLYPCLVMPGTVLHDEWKAGRFEPIDADEAVARIAEAASFFPPWVRVMRMQRDIPVGKIAAGVKSGHLHELVTKAMEEAGTRCRCIRCREVFASERREKKKEKKNLSLELVSREYAASGGVEHFLSFEDVEQDLLAGFIRLRLPPPHSKHRPEITSTTALIRELHIYGQEVEIEATKAEPSASSLLVQHHGLGKALLTRAQEIAADAGRDKMVIISGVGVRPYYARLGYERDGPYLAKKL